MELKEGTSVYTSDGKEAGRLHRVVIDPETNEVTHIVVQRGLLNKEDKVVNVHKIALASFDKVTLQCSADELNEMAPLEVAEYVQVGGTRSGDTFKPAEYGYYANPIPTNPAVEVVKRTIPEELVALKEGAPVLSKDDEQVGHIERVITDPVSGQVTHFIVSQGLLLKARKMVPIDWVKLLADDKVYLDVGTQHLSDLPPWQED